MAASGAAEPRSAPLETGTIRLRCGLGVYATIGVLRSHLLPPAGIGSGHLLDHTAGLVGGPQRRNQATDRSTGGFATSCGSNTCGPFVQAPSSSISSGSSGHGHVLRGRVRPVGDVARERTHGRREAPAQVRPWRGPRERASGGLRTRGVRRRDRPTLAEDDARGVIDADLAWLRLGRPHQHSGRSNPRPRRAHQSPPMGAGRQHPPHPSGVRQPAREPGRPRGGLCRVRLRGRTRPRST